jgi:CO/xanthine dehydrogenase FAD-binding subunit
VPGALTAGDLCDLAGGLAPKPLRLEALVDHLNRGVSLSEMQRAYAPAMQAYAAAPRAISFAETRSSPAAWLVQQLR